MGGFKKVQQFYKNAGVNLPLIVMLHIHSHILRDPGTVSGCGEVHVGQEKNLGKEVSKTRVFLLFLSFLHATFFLAPPRGGGVGTPLFGLYGDVPLDRVWFFGLAVLNRVYNLTYLCPKQGQNLS